MKHNLDFQETLAGYKVIGLSGWARSGKDTVGEILRARHGFELISFANVLKECVYALNPVVHEFPGDPWDQQNDPDEYWRVQDIVDKYGWDEAKEDFPEIRRLLQFFGTEVGRNIIDEDIWVNTAFRKMEAGNMYAITDVRFKNEARKIQQVGGVVCRVQRPNNYPVNAHSSEHDLDDYEFDHTLDNSGDMVYLEHQVEHLLDVAGVQ